MKKWNWYWNGARVKSSEISFISCKFSNCYPICNLNFTVECLNCIFVSFSSCCISVCVACPLAPASPRYSSLIESKVFPLTHSPTPLPLPVRCKTKRQTDSGKVENFYTLCRLFRLFRRRSFWCVSCINKRARCYCYFYCFAAVVGLECVNARCVCLSNCPSVCPDDYDSTHNSRTTRADTQRNQRTYDNKIERVAADCSRQFLLHKMPNCLARLTANNKQLTTNEEWPNLELPSGKCKPSCIFACETAGFALWPG